MKIQAVQTTSATERGFSHEQAMQTFTGIVPVYQLQLKRNE